MIVDMVSDLHGFYPEMPGGDLLIVAGDLTSRDTHGEYIGFYSWLHKQNYKHYIFIAGNHDNLLEKENMLARCLAHSSYLCDSGTEFEGLKIWGSPYTLRFSHMNPKCMAFTVDDDYELSRHWAKIPDDTDILVTHSPSWGMHDTVEDYPSGEILNVGSRSLLHWSADHYNTLKLHVYGHIHEGYGVWDQRKLQKRFNGKEGSVFVNASHVNERYLPVNKPIRIIL